MKCHYCSDGASTTYRRGFQRDTVVCDRGVGNLTLSLYSLNHFQRFFLGYTSRPCGFVTLQLGHHYRYYCSLGCLNQDYPIAKLSDGMNDFDKTSILEEVAIQNENTTWINKTKCNITWLKSSDLEDDSSTCSTSTWEESEESDTEESYLEMIEQQKEIIQTLVSEKKADEDKLKTEIEKKWMEKMNELTEKVLEKDKLIFTMQCRIIELERKESKIEMI